MNEKLQVDLFWATRKGDLDNVRELVEKGANVNHRMPTNLIVAGAILSGGAATVMGYFAILPAMNAVGYLGMAIGGIGGVALAVVGGLFAAGFVGGGGMGAGIGYGGLYAIEFLALRGATALHVAAFYGHEELVRYLLKHGADVLAVDFNDKTPLDIVCTYASPFGYYDAHLNRYRSRITKLLNEARDVALLAEEENELLPLIQLPATALSAVTSQANPSENRLPVDFEEFDNWNEIQPNPLVRNSLLGRGSFGSVHQALFRRQQVAIKIGIPTSTRNIQQFYDQAVQEAKVTCTAKRHVLNEHYIIRFYGLIRGKLTNHLAANFGLPNQRTAIGLIFKLETGGSLDQYLEKHPELSLQERIRLLTEIADALSELHRIGIIHGDLKPSNILLSDGVNPSIKIADFGLSTITEQIPATIISDLQTTRTQVNCTHLYAAPEMLPNPFHNGEQRYALPSRSTDIYAFALICYEVISGQKPFGHITPAVNDLTLPGLLHSTENNRPLIDQTTLSDQVPTVVRQLMVDCWDSNRDKRYSSFTCYTILDTVYQRLISEHWDIFLSHTWASKNIVSHLRSILRRRGYRVWYDLDDMPHHLTDGMSAGINRSQLLVACINQVYQDRVNCQFELQEATRFGKTIITVVLEENPVHWANDIIRTYCNIANLRYIDISEVASQACWEEAFVNHTDPPTDQMNILSSKADELIRLLGTLNCHPTFV